jgi:hypothetical protein
LRGLLIALDQGDVVSFFLSKADKE